MSRPGVPPVTIGLPVFNGARYLAAALDSLLAQTYRDFELIISDNASTDQTEHIARDYAARDARIRYLRNETNIGAARNYMRALDSARGAYFRWATYDDLSGPESLERCIEILDREPTVVLAYPKTTLIDGEGRTISDYEDNLHVVYDRPSKRFGHVLQWLGRCNAIYGLMRAEVTRKVRPLGAFINSDLCFVAELSLYGKFWEVPEHLFFRRMHPEAFSSLDVAGRQAFYDPSRPDRMSLHIWRRLWENFEAVWRTPLEAGEKSAALRILARRVLWRRNELLWELRGALHDLVQRRSS